ncbi:unnamed protein product [Symbiodinium sp. KB8]|nr:unnamed protein product [Symbiodinium sp. KB8]
MARESEPVILSGLGAAWYGNPEVRDRLSFEASSSLILPASGEKVPIASQETAVVNDMFLIPIIIQMRAASSLKIPSLETIAEELEALWIKYHEDEDYRRMVANFGNKAQDADYPELDTLRADASHAAPCDEMPDEEPKPLQMEPKPASRTAAKTKPKNHSFEPKNDDDDDDCEILGSSDGLEKVGKRAQLAAQIERLKFMMLVSLLGHVCFV